MADRLLELLRCLSGLVRPKSKVGGGDTSHPLRSPAPRPGGHSGRTGTIILVRRARRDAASPGGPGRGGCAAPRHRPARSIRTPERCSAYDGTATLASLVTTSTGFTCQMSLAYSAIVRSELNLPVRAMLRMRLLAPALRVAVQLFDPSLSIDEAAQVGEIHVVIAMIEQRRDDRPEDPRFGQAEEVVADQIDRPPDLFIALVEVARIVAARAALDLLRRSGRR